MRESRFDPFEDPFEYPFDPPHGLLAMSGIFNRFGDRLL